MNTTRGKIFLAVGALLTVTLCTALLYTARLPPFTETGDIKATDLCPTLGASTDTAVTLKEILPERASYSFNQDVDPRLDESDSYYNSSCFVSGEDERLLTAKAVMIQEESMESWTNWVKGTATDKSFVQNLQPFPFGDASVASHRFAAAFIPCTSRGKVPGGQYNLSISVELKEAGNVDDATTQSQLLDLVKSSASHAVSAAKCDMSQELANNN